MKNSTSSLLLLSALLITGCDTSKVTGGLLGTNNNDGLYSTRSQLNDPVITILKLSNPALLESATRKNGKLEIDKQLLADIEAEQKETIAKLQALSSEVQILATYKLVLNGLSVMAPPEIFEQIKFIPNITFEKSSSFGRPVLEDDEFTKAPAVGPRTSVNFIGADAAYAENVRGQNMRVGIIDTGIDYTHKMFAGEGTREAYKAVNPNLPNPAFPNKKVVGGIDLVGTAFNTASANIKHRIPVPDDNPLDEASHGTHVAGTVAGIGDGVNTYDGVAPDALLYAIKVFGAKGSTSDNVVISALEYAADPSRDLSFKEQLDVVNLSLGSGYGNPHIMYNEAIKNLVRGGTVVVASAGNSGDSSYIVGAPGVSDDAISVASSVDNTNQNVEFPAVTFTFAAGSLDTEIIEGAIGVSLDKVTEMSGELIYLGTGALELTPEEKEATVGKIALMDRGGKSAEGKPLGFADKYKIAQEAGAIAIIVANNVEGEPISMGGDGKFKIPGAMISLPAAQKIKDAMKVGPVVADLKSAIKIQKPWLTDTISSFSSRGPRSDDGMIKPEISAPGTNIISAQSGGGDIGLSISGTSMAGPHIAGVMALLKQKYTDLSPNELKSVLMGHGKVIADKDKKTYTVSRQGAGRVQVAESLKAQVVSVPAALSFGITDIEKQKTMAIDVTLKNISKSAVTLTAVWSGSTALKVSAPNVTLAAGESKTISVIGKLVGSEMKGTVNELDGYLQFKSGEDSALQVPALVVARKISKINGTALTVASSASDAAGSVVTVDLKNDSINSGEAYLFNLLGTAGRKPSKMDLVHNRACDLQSAGYRVIEKDGERVLQIAVKLYEGMTTWHRCEANVQIDSNNDNLADQELAGLPLSSLPGLSVGGFGSLLLDANQARQIRKKFEVDFHAPQEPGKPKATVVENYLPAVVDLRGMNVFDGSTLAIVEAKINALALGSSGELNIKISTNHQDDGAVQPDDYLNGHETQWQKISVMNNGQSYVNLPEVIELTGKESKTVTVKKGYGSDPLVIYAPQNKSVRDNVLEDDQSQILKETYEE